MSNTNTTPRVPAAAPNTTVGTKLGLNDIVTGREYPVNFYLSPPT